MSAIAATKSPIVFIGTGEHITDFEAFKTESFVSKLLGRGDLESLVEVMEIFNKNIDMASFESDLKQGKFTLRNLQEQLNALMSIGPIDQFMSSIPGFKPEMLGIVPGQTGDMNQTFSSSIRMWMTVMDSMTSAELEHPDPITLFRKEPSRYARCAKGCGVSISEVTDRIKRSGEMLRVFKKIGPILGNFKDGAGTNKMPDQGQMNKMNSELMRFMNPAALKQMGGQAGLSEMMRNMTKLNPKAMKNGGMGGFGDMFG